MAVKLLAIDALKAGITSSEVCELIGVSNSALGKWRKLYQEGGEGALALRPKLIIGDEPVSALDVSIRAQGLNLMESLKSEFDLSYIFISHDLSIIQYISDRVGVTYLGKLIEFAYSSDLYYQPSDPYTKALMAAAPVLDLEIKKRRIVLHSEFPSPLDPPSGCRFHTRCYERKDICKTDDPELKRIGEEHFFACHLASSIKSIPFLVENHY